LCQEAGNGPWDKCWDAVKRRAGSCEGFLDHRSHPLESGGCDAKCADNWLGGRTNVRAA